MPPLEGVNPGDFKADDSNIERDGHVVPYHRLEPQGPISPCPYPFVATSPSKGRPKRGFPKYDVGSWSWWVILCKDSRSGWPPLSCRGIMAPTREQPAPWNDMERVGMCKAYLVCDWVGVAGLKPQQACCLSRC
jgi:hypothetical protein